MDRIKSFSPLSSMIFGFARFSPLWLKGSLLIRFLDVFRRFTDANSTDRQRNHKIAVQYTSSAPGGDGPGADVAFDSEYSKFLTFSKEKRPCGERREKCFDSVGSNHILLSFVLDHSFPLANNSFFSLYSLISIKTLSFRGENINSMLSTV